MSLILLARVYVQDLDEFTTQWREYLFNTLDPDGPILENLVINSTAFELTDGALVWTNPDTGDEYFYDSPYAVTKVDGEGPVIPPPLPDLSDPYGLKYYHEYQDWQGRTCRFEIFQKDYEGEDEEVDGAGGNLRFTFENGGKLFQSFRGSRASLTLHSQVSRKFYELFEGDERDHYGRYLREGTVLWTGWITPDIFNEPWGNAPYQTTLNFNDGIGGLKNLPFPDVNDNDYTGQISEKDAIIACLGRIGLRLDVHIACNISEVGMDELSAPIEQSMVNVEAFVNFSQGENQPLNCYEVMAKILKSWNAVLLQEENKWWIVREPELYGSSLSYSRYDADGVLLGTATRSLEKTFVGEGILLHGATLETKPAFSNVAVAQQYGELLVENGNFAVNGNMEKWTPYILGGYQQGWKLNDWIYDQLQVFPFTDASSLGSVQRVSESTGLDAVNNFINIYGLKRNFTDPIGRLISKPVPIRQEVGNMIEIKFTMRCAAEGSGGDRRLVEAYYNVAVRCGTKWLTADPVTEEYSWTSTETRIRWKVPETYRWENIVLPAMEIPEDGDIQVYLYPIVQPGSISKVRYVAGYDDVEIKLVNNPALQNSRIYYKTNNPETYTSTLEELTIELGDVATVMSQNAKIVTGEPSSLWARAGITESVPLAKLICRELANQYQRTIYRLKGGNFRKDASRLATYQDSVNEPDRKFILTGGDYNAKSGEWNPDFMEINQEETTVEIRVVAEAKSGRDGNTGSNGGNVGGGTGGNTPQTPGVPLDLGDQDDIIPIIREGKFEDSKIQAVRNEDDDIIQHQFINTVKGVPATEGDEFVTKSQLPTVTQYGLLNGGTIQWRGDGLWFLWAPAVVAIGGPLNAPDAEIELDEAHPTLNREDLLGWLKVDDTLAIPHVIKGTPASAFAPDPYDPTQFFPGISVKIPAAATTPDGTITTENVYIDNAPEWAVTFSGTGTGNADSTTNPDGGTGKAVEVTNPANQFRARFTRSTALDLSTLMDATVGLRLDLKAAYSNQQNLEFVFLDASNNPVSNVLQLTLNKSLLDYQFIGFPLADLTFTSQTVKAIEIIYRQRGGGTHPGFWLDNVKIQGGVTQPNPSGGIPDAPRDGTTYGRKDGGWVAVSGGGLADAPSDGNFYGRKNAAWVGIAPEIIDGLNAASVDSPGSSNRFVTVSLLNSYGYTQEAPINGNYHARKDGAWVAFTPGIQHAASDGNYYASRNGGWTAFTPFTVAGTPTDGHVITSVSGVPTWAAPSGGGGGNFIAYDTAQSLTGSQRQQALDNIGSSAGSLETFTNSGTVTINDLAISKSNIEFAGSSTVTLNGIVPLWNGQEMVIFNRTGNNLTIAREAAGSSGANRFWSTIVIPTGFGIVIKYSNVNGSFRWAIVGNSFYMDSGGNGLITRNNVGVNVTPYGNIGFVVRNVSGSTYSFAIEDATGARMFEGRQSELMSLFRHNFYATSGFASIYMKPTGTGGNQWCYIAQEFGGANGASLKWNMIYSSKGGAYFGNTDGISEPGTNRRVRIRGFGTTTGETLYLEDSGGTLNARFLDNGQIQFNRLPTSSSGLSAGSLWNDSGTIKIV